MIILDEEDHVKFDALVAGSTVRYPDKAVGRSLSSLPDYESSEAQHRLIIRNLQSSSKKTRNARILKATFYALAIYVALSAVIVLPVVLKRRSSEASNSRAPSSANIWIEGNSPPANFIDAAVIPFSSSNFDCDEWQQLINGSPALQASYPTYFPSTSPIAIRSNISSIDYQVTNGVGGSLTVGINSDHKATEIVVQLQANASDYTLLQQTNICVCQQDPNRGMTIYAPGNLSEFQYLNFNIQLLFPWKSSPYVVPGFITYLPQFSQQFAHLSKHVTFNKVSIFGTMNEIECQSMKAPIIGIQNIRSSITGTFHVSESLILDTIDGPITSNISFASIMATPTLILDTGNGAINAAVSLSSSNNDAKSPSPIFNSRVKTFSAPINLSFDAPTGLPLRLYVANNGAPTNISLQSSYRGGFDLQTKLAPASVNGPSQPVIAFDTQSYERMCGCIGDCPPPPATAPSNGQIVVVSALGPISLSIVS
ncbi:hypothetical protein F5887DRAFT_953166 [Amanita rubescens]|nr:hypothetical protein F5887DRAFT_1040135 [Amanita rubescens]KAF8348339.1 hypothetical protein F5887DRAFT_953166 [Amanita rubescens]